MSCAKDHAKEKTDDKDRVNEGKEYRQRIMDKDNVESGVAETYQPPEKDA